MFGGSIDEELQILLTLDADGYVKTAKVVGTATKSLDRDLDALTNRNKKVKSSFGDIDAQLGKLKSTFSAAMGAAKFFVGTLAALDTAIIGGGIAASQKAAEFEALEISLTAVEGSAKKAQAAMAELRQIAKGPGLGVQSAIELYGGLRRGGIDSASAMEMTRQTGNAVAFTGGGKDELGRIAIALQQIAVSPTLRGQDVMQLAQARLPVYQALKNQFGTSDTAELEKMGISAKQAIAALSVEFAKLPRVAGGAKNTFENLSDALEYMAANIGKGINDGIMPTVNEFTDAIGKLNEDGTLRTFGESLAGVFVDILDTVTGSAGTTQSVLDSAMESLLAVAIASRNIADNASSASDGARDIFDRLRAWFNPAGIPIIDRAMDPFGIIGKKHGNGGWGPTDEASRQMDAIRNQRRMYADAQMSRRLAPDGKGGLKWVLDLPGGGTVDEDKATEAQKRASKSLKEGKKGTGSPAVDAPLDPTVGILSKIEHNTRRTAERLENIVIGGGTATNAALSQRNLSAMAGIPPEAQHHIAQAMLIIGNASQVSNARLRTYNPRSH